jgi:hypothetical protein
VVAVAAAAGLLAVAGCGGDDDEPRRAALCERPTDRLVRYEREGGLRPGTAVVEVRCDGRTIALVGRDGVRDELEAQLPAAEVADLRRELEALGDVEAQDDRAVPEPDAPRVRLVFGDRDVRTGDAGPPPGLEPVLRRLDALAIAP